MSNENKDVQKVDLDDEPDEWYACPKGTAELNNVAVSRLTTSQGQENIQHWLRRYGDGRFKVSDSDVDVQADENARLTDCYYAKKDWRACKKEVGWRSTLCGSGTEMLPTKGCFDRG
jgi:hypothetical protein